MFYRDWLNSVKKVDRALKINKISENQSSVALKLRPTCQKKPFLKYNPLWPEGTGTPK